MTGQNSAGKNLTCILRFCMNVRRRITDFVYIVKICMNLTERWTHKYSFKRLFYQGLLIRTAIVVKGRGVILLTSISEVQLQTGAKYDRFFIYMYLISHTVMFQGIIGGWCTLFFSLPVLSHLEKLQQSRYYDIHSSANGQSFCKLVVTNLKWHHNSPSVICCRFRLPYCQPFG